MWSCIYPAAPVLDETFKESEGKKSSPRTLLATKLVSKNQSPSARHSRSIPSKCERVVLDQKSDRTKLDICLQNSSKPESLLHTPDLSPYGSPKLEFFAHDPSAEPASVPPVSTGDIARPSSASRVHLPSGKKQAAVKAVPRSDLPPPLSQSDARDKVLLFPLFLFKVLFAGIKCCLQENFFLRECNTMILALKIELPVKGK